MRRSRMIFIAAALMLLTGSAFTIPAFADRGSHASEGRGDRDDGGHHRSEHDSDDDDDDHRPLPLPTTAPADDSEGSHSWDGRLCDGSPFTIDYTIAHKRVTVDHVEGPSSNIRSVTQGARVSFDDVDGRVTLSMSRRGHLKIDARLGRCDTNVTTTAPPAPTTTVQGTTPTTGNVTTTAMATTTTTAKATTTTAKATTTTAKATTTTQPVPQPKYLTYNLPVGTVVVKLEDPPNRMARWSTKTPGWLYYTSKDSGTSIVIEFQNASTGEKGDFHATLSGGTVTASFTGSGGTVTPAPSSSTVDPGKTNPSG